MFRTHTGRIVSGNELEVALVEVANDYRELALAIRKENSYASHVTEEQKEENMARMFAMADDIERGEGLNNFTIWQRINTKITGECVAFLNK